jgi:hypothetical protein
MHKQAGKQKFFKSEVICVLLHLLQKYIIGDDFNCVLYTYDCTGDFNPCKALEALVKNLDIVDAWWNTPDRRAYTYYAVKVASTVGRLDINRNLSKQKVGTETVAAAFTDRLAVVLRNATDK